ncbi:MAG: DUF3127 domain-containing protein [Bacteroidota bacterium]
MSFEIEGKLYRKFDTQTKSASFQAREFVLEVGGTYAQFIKFQLTQDRCALIDNYNEGDVLKVFFDLRGREWNDKFFTNLNAWKIERAGNAEVPPAPTEEDVPNFGDGFPSANDEPQIEYKDDLPF